MAAKKKVMKKNIKSKGNGVEEPVEASADETALVEAEGAEEPITAISEAESLEIREEARKLKAQIDSSYFDFAGVLYRIYDNHLYKQWGFDSFKVYVEQELGTSVRRAQYLVGIWDYLVNDVGDPSVIEKIKPLGWSKAKELKDVVNADNVDEWVSKAEEMNVATLAEAAKAALGGSFEEGEEEESSQVEVPKTLSFKLFQEQMENVTNALKRASELTNSTKNGHLLDSICSDYLAQNAFTAEGKSALSSFLTKFEDQLGVRLFAFDPDKNECSFGEDDAVKLVLVDMKNQEILCGEDTLRELLEDDEEGEEQVAEAATA